MKNIKVLIVDDDKVDRLFIKRELLKIDPNIICHESDSAETTLELINQEDFDCITLDHHLPDVNGLDTLRQIEEIMPIIMITGDEDESLPFNSVKYGAQDFLSKHTLSGNQLYRAICFSIERNRLLTNERNLSFRDELTELYNRRGFLHYAQKRLEITNRPNYITRLLFIDIDNLKYVNDTFGHEMGDQIIVDTADILRYTFRKTDLISRLAGDEFAVLLTRTSSTFRKNSIYQRLKNNIKKRNAAYPLHISISMTMGFADYDKESNYSLEELLSKADKAMYRNKRRKNKRRSSNPQ